MTAKRKILATVVLALASNGALAQAYVGINHTWAKETVDAVNIDVNHKLAILKGGYQFSDWVTAEARYGQATTSEDLFVYGLTTKYTLEQYYGGMSWRFCQLAICSNPTSRSAIRGLRLDFRLSERYSANFKVMRFSDSAGRIDGVPS